MTSLLRDTLTALGLAAAVCGIALLAIAILGFLVAAWRVGVCGRVLVIPFQGTDERRVALTGLFACRLMEIEERWTELARQIADLKRRFEEQSAPIVTDHDSRAPLTSGAPLQLPPAEGRTAAVGATPRTPEDDFLDDILLLGENPLSAADLGVIAVGGLTFSPQNIIALGRRLPELFARRILTGTVVRTGDDHVLSVVYEERRFRHQHRRVRRVTTVAGEDWLAAIEQLGFDLAKGRIELLRDARGRGRDPRRAVIAGEGSQTADRAVIEARSWRACEAFLTGYVSHIDHYVTGRAESRERALRSYDRALETEPGYTRASYHSAALLYNRYRPSANDQAIAGFEAATQTDDLRLRALAFAGVAMAYAQATHRFGRERTDVIGRVVQASEDAIKLDPDLEEAVTARAWAHQVQEEWDDAVRRYLEVGTRGHDSSPARRMASFARNNAAWLWLEPLRDRDGALAQAERLLWQAVREYPNKVAYVNLAEIARRLERYEDAVTLFERALTLDPEYLNAWNERACLELEIAGRARARGDMVAFRSAVAEAAAHHERAVSHAEDDDYARGLRDAFEAAGRRLGPLAPEPAAP